MTHEKRIKRAAVIRQKLAIVLDEETSGPVVLALIEELQEGLGGAVAEASQIEGPKGGEFWYALLEYLREARAYLRGEIGNSDSPSAM